MLRKENRKYLEKCRKNKQRRAEMDKYYELGKEKHMAELGKLSSEVIYYLYETTYEQQTAGLKFIEALRKHYPNSREYDLVKGE